MKGLVAYKSPHHHKNRLTGLANVYNAKTNDEAFLRRKEGIYGQDHRDSFKVVFSEKNKICKRQRETPISFFLVNHKNATARKAFWGSHLPSSQKGLLEKQN